MPPLSRYDGTTGSSSSGSHSERNTNTPSPNTHEEDETNSGPSATRTNAEPDFTTINIRHEGRGAEIVHEVLSSNYNDEEQLYQLENARRDPSLTANDRHMILAARVGIITRRGPAWPQTNRHNVSSPPGQENANPRPNPRTVNIPTRTGPSRNPTPVSTTAINNAHANPQPVSNTLANSQQNTARNQSPQLTYGHFAAGELARLRQQCTDLAGSMAEREARYSTPSPLSSESRHQHRSPSRGTDEQAHDRAQRRRAHSAPPPFLQTQIDYFYHHADRPGVFPHLSYMAAAGHGNHPGPQPRSSSSRSSRLEFPSMSDRALVEMRSARALARLNTRAMDMEIWRRILLNPGQWGEAGRTFMRNPLLQAGLASHDWGGNDSGEE
ncbi:hypothetical protein J1614_000436 [Plenodomus biglobosus]|nr:hypothetical protein J1614_000436 [Plenodomus biglobosus]